MITDVVRDVSSRMTTRGFVAEFYAEGLNLLDRFHAGDLDYADAPRLALALHLIEVRDRAWRAINPVNARERSQAWTAFAIQIPIPPAFVAPTAFLSGCAAYLTGDTGRAMEALTVAVRCQPDYTAANLLVFAIEAGLPGKGFDQSAIDLTQRWPEAVWLRPLADRIALHQEITTGDPEGRSS